ncbi:MAG: hypothetical protein JNK05_12755 [Myxococcales bacterium]|nr:hypothetical protein [Myxococcales bacterium]
MIVLELELTDDGSARALIEGQLLQRRVFVAGARDVLPPVPCSVVFTLLGQRVTLAGEIVYAQATEPGAGVGVQLAPLPADAKALIDVYLASGDLPMPEPPGPDADASELPDETPSGVALTEADGGAPPDALHVRMRALTSVEQRRYATTGSLAERVMLERLYGPNVWEALLGSGRLSMPEVATIARKGTIPRPLVELIASNAGWLASGEVQRALLSNPRSSPAVISKILRMMPKHELARVPNQTAYPISVRSAAKEMIKGAKG